MAQIRIYSFIALVIFSFYGLGIFWTHNNQTALTLFTKEDGFLEWLTFLTFLSTALFCFFALYLRVRANLWGYKDLKFWGLFACGCVFILGAGEEISWGQRLFEFQSPEFFSKNNNQAETNIHNLKVNGVKLNKLIFGKVLFVVVFLHNVVLPLVAIKKKKLNEWMENIGGFFPPWPLVVIYIGGALLVGFVDHVRHKEILEVSGALHYSSSLFLTHALGVNYSKPLLEKLDNKIIAATGFIVFFLFLTLVAWILSTALKL